MTAHHLDFTDEQIESFKAGLCYGLSQHYLYAAMLSRQGRPEELVNFTKRLCILSMDESQKALILGKEYTSLPEAISDAADIFKKYEKHCQQAQKPSDFYGEFRTLYPEAFMLMEIRPWVESLFFSHSPDQSTLLQKYFTSRDIRKTSPWLVPDLFPKEEDFGTLDHSDQSQKAETDIQDMNSPIVTGQHWAFQVDHNEMMRLIEKLPNGDYFLINKIHATAISIHDGIVTFFDQNLKGYYIRVSTDDRESLSAFCTRILKSIRTGGEEHSAFSIAYVGISTDGGREAAERANQYLKSQESKLNSRFDDYGPVDLFKLSCAYGNTEKTLQLEPVNNSV